MGVVNIPYPKNYALRDAIYELIGEGRKQFEISDLLKEKGLSVKKSRVSQIVTELEREEYIICTINTVPKFYSITKKSYPYKSRGLENLRCGCKTKLRIHNQFFKYQITSKSYVTNDIKRWDKVIPMKNGVIQYIYYGHDALGRGLTVQRLEGKNTDTLVIKIADMDWDYDKLDKFDEFILEKRIRAEYGITHYFKMQIRYSGRTKTSYAIRPAPYPELQQAFQLDNYKFGGLQGDSSKEHVSELETDIREKAIRIMEFLNLADSGRLPELFNILMQIKKIDIPLTTIIDVIKDKSEKDLLNENENRERGVI